MAGARQLLNRELSWLDFDRRVLDLAADPSVPLLERVKLCGITSSNLDEFFAVRMAGTRAMIESEVISRSPDGRTAHETLKEARDRVRGLNADQDALWLDVLQPALADERIRITPVEECTARELRTLTKRFEREIAPLLTPIAVGPAAAFPYIPSLTLNIGAFVIDPVTAQCRFVRVNVPDGVPRFVGIGSRSTRVLLEDVILHHLDRVLGNGTRTFTLFRVTRDADFALSDDADDLLEAVEHQLAQRRFGAVVRLEVAHEAPAEVLDVLTRELQIAPDQIYPRRSPLGLAALLELASFDRPELKHDSWRPVTRRPFLNRSPASLLARIRRSDLLVHHPYDAYKTSVEAFAAAARDPKVAMLKGTVYRTDDLSRTMSSLVKAAECGKQAVCLVELQARFDELRNIKWSRALERAGVDVVYGVPQLKVHAKLTLLGRRERGGVRQYAHIGTGNYHAKHAMSYEDLGLLTADDEIAADVADVFNAVTGLATPTVFRKLLVGPWFLREGIVHEIERVAQAARTGEPARIRIKVNAIGDPEIVDALYAASTAGATVEIISRGICTLRPGIPNVSEGITVRSVLGRFLEHSRIYSFQAGDNTTMWIGSADLMPRNLDRRVEVLAPVDNVRLRNELTYVLDTLLADTRFSWELDSDGFWHRTSPRGGAKPMSAQETLRARAAKRARAR